MDFGLYCAYRWNYWPAFFNNKNFAKKKKTLKQVAVPGWGQGAQAPKSCLSAPPKLLIGS